MATKAKKKAATPPTMECFLACESISRDPSGGKTTLYGLFDTIWADGFPVFFKPFGLFIKLRGGKSQYKVTIQGSAPGGNAFEKSPELTVNRGASGGSEISVQMGATPIPKAGKLQFVVLVDGEQVGWPCEIDVKKRSN